ncbi:restriction endonuclease subunit S [Inhella sp.]|uniref:restriction endonuclease subunit S n=1 Tax=Inhella sp. TaxID=1921806 RepID=UPI0035B2C7A2
MLDAKKNKGTPQPYLGNSNVRWGNFDLSDLAEMRFEPEEEERYGLLTGDLVVCEGGEPGRCAIWTAPVPTMKIQKALHRIRPKSSLDNYYLYYWFCHAAKADLLEPHFTGTTIKHLTGKALAALQVPLPPIAVQAAMVDVLRSLDDRITLLRETNATLEAIAQALFKSWFVDFDPVRAKLAGRAPEGLDEATAALFPDSFEDSELGEVPRGWTVRPIGDCVETVGGATPDTKKEEFWEPAEFAWTTPKDLSGATAPVLTETERRLSASGLAKIGSGLLPVGSLLMSSRAPIGYLAITDLPVAVNQGYIGMLPGGVLPPLYMLRWCEANMEQIKGRANGSTFMEISKKAFRPIPAVVPTSDAIDAFSAIAQPLFNRVIANERQARSLATLRDTLLPRLISGQLRLPEATESIEEALA